MHTVLLNTSSAVSGVSVPSYGGIKSGGDSDEAGDDEGRENVTEVAASKAMTAINSTVFPSGKRHAAPIDCSVERQETMKWARGLTQAAGDIRGASGGQVMVRTG